MTIGRTVRCAIYTRKSTEEGLEQDFNSLDAQRESCNAYILSQKPEGWVWLPVHYDDGGYSGGTLDRPALQNLLTDIEAGKVDVVVVYKIDRLSRSLMDFAKLVEVFDRKKITFVSVTQSFNTTTSMGRLTLNMLLSFAQFEREITGERIRDKFAASKKKGIWMGGTPPLGYDIENRKLIINPEEAEIVRLIFRRYLDLGGVRALCDDLRSRQIVSKSWTSHTGSIHKGRTFTRGAIYHLLKNRIYRGQIVHKDVAYPGEHEAIVPVELFGAVQNRLDESRRCQLGKPRARHNSPLAGLLFDDQGTPMTPTHSVNPRGRRYRYYVSQSVFERGSLRASISRIPAAAIEEIIAKVLARLHFSSHEQHGDNGHRSVLRRIDIKSDSILILLDHAEAIRAWKEQERELDGVSDRDLIERQRGYLAAGEELNGRSDRILLTLPMRAQFRGGRSSTLPAPGSDLQSVQLNAPLLKAIARAHRWKQMLLNGEMHSIEAFASQFGCDRRDAGRTLALAFLSPALTKAILEGFQDPRLRLSHLLKTDIPLSWHSQKAVIKRLVDAQND